LPSPRHHTQALTSAAQASSYSETVAYGLMLQEARTVCAPRHIAGVGAAVVT
jgi:hypothetical protein